MEFVNRFAVALLLWVGTCTLLAPQPAVAGLYCPDACSGNGRCVFEGPLNRERKGWIFSRVCECDPGWTAPNCSLCTANDVCPGRQVCRFGSCRCPVGWQGDRCDQCYSSVGCGKHGNCFEEQCVCEPGWAGIDCQTPTGSVMDAPAGAGAGEGDGRE